MFNKIHYDADAREWYVEFRGPDGYAHAPMPSARTIARK